MPFRPQRGRKCLKNSPLTLDEIADDNGKKRGYETSIYFYHPDHLGTNTLITDLHGDPYQFFVNLPYGETMIEQSNIVDYDNPFKFNGKELDTETGLYYYGARYYDPTLSVWLGVDPLAEKYTAWSSYAYCLDNPIIYIDHDGREVLPTNKLKANSSVYSFFQVASSNSVWKNMMKNFYANQNSVYVHLGKLRNSNNAPSGFTNVARTESHLSTSNPVSKFGQHRIIINSDILNSSGEIGIDQTFLMMALVHEGDHARMFERFKQSNGTFEGFLGHIDFILNRSGGDGHHNQMGAFNRSILVDAMKEFDNQFLNGGGTVPDYHTEDWYQAMSWYGLRNTQAWKDFKANNPEKSAQYHNLINQQIERNKNGIERGN